MILRDAHGRQSHVVIPWEVWEMLTMPTVEPDEDDLEAIERLERLPKSALAPAPLTNPIRKARLEKGILQTELSEAMGITQGRLSQLEQEGRTPEPATIRRALEALKKMSVH